MAVEAVPWSNLLPAIFGFLGVIVGASITAVSSYLLDERRSKREREREERDRLTVVTRAARMIDADFSTAHACASYALKQNCYWDSSKVPLTVKGWNDYAAIIAPAVSSDAWLKIRLGIDAIKNLNDYREFDASRPTAQAIPLSSQRFPPLSSEFRQGVESEANNLLDARKALAPLSFE